MIRVLVAGLVCVALLCVAATAPLTITATPVVGTNEIDATANQQYTSSNPAVTFTAQGGSGSYTWSISAGGLAPGLMLSSTTGSSISIIGITKWVAVQKPYTLTLQVRDSGGNTTTASFVLKVFGVPTLVVPSSLNLSSTAGGTSQPQTLHVSATTVDPISFDISQPKYQNGSGWLTISGGSDAFDYTVTANAGSLGGGTYSASLTVSCHGQTCLQAPAPVQIVLTVSSPTLSLNQGQLTFALRAGTVSTSQTFQVSSSAGPLSVTTASDPWITVSPKSGTTPATLTVAVDATSLAVGQKTGTIAISCTGTSSCAPTQLNVVANVTANLSVDSTTLTFQATTPNGKLPAAQNVHVTAPDSESFALTYSPQGSWLSVTANQSVTPAVLTVSIVSIPAQSSTGTITITSSDKTETIPITVKLNISGAAPSVSVGGIVTASDFGGFSSASPGTYIEIYGLNLSATNPGRGWSCQDFTNNCTNAPTSLDGTSVTVAGHNAFVRYVSPTQVNALIPSDVPAGVASVIVTNAAGSSSPYNLTINTIQPGLLAKSNGSKTYAAAVYPDGTVALPGSAVSSVKPGDVVILFGIGFGPVTPTVPAGTVYSQQTTLNAPVQILFGNTPVNILYAGLAPGFTGLYQFNIQVPQIPDNDAVPLSFNVGGVSGTQQLYIAVHH